MFPSLRTPYSLRYNTDNRSVNKQGMSEKHWSEACVCLAFNEKLETSWVREEGVGKDSQIRSQASRARCEGNRKVLEGNETSAPGNSRTRGREEPTKRANLIAVVLEDTASDPNLQSDPPAAKR